MGQGVGELNVAVTARTTKARADLNALASDIRKLPNATKLAEGGLAAMQSKLGFMTGFASKLTAAGLFAGAVAGVKRQFNELDTLGKSADKIGIATEKLIGLRFAADEAGVDVGQLESSMVKMVRKVSEAANGSESAGKAISALGLDVNKLQAMAPDEQFKSFAMAIQSIRPEADQTSAAISIFGRAGSDLLNVLRLTRPAFDEAQREVERLGLTIDRAAVKKVEAANDAIGRMTKSLQTMAREGAVVAAPAVEGLAGAWEKFFIYHGGGMGAKTLNPLKYFSAGLDALAGRDRDKAAVASMDAMTKWQERYRQENGDPGEIAAKRAAEAEKKAADAAERRLELDKQRAKVEQERAARLAAEEDQLKNLRDQIADFGKDPLVAERDRAIRDAGSTEFAQQLSDLYTVLIRFDREQKAVDLNEKAQAESSRRRKQLAARDRDLRFEADAIRMGRTSSPLDARSAEGYAALRANMGSKSVPEQQLAEARKQTVFLSQMVAGKHVQPLEVFSLN